MTAILRLLVRAVAFGGVGYAFRKKLVAILTKTTGTWVGTPDA